MRVIRAATQPELDKLCAEIDLVPSKNLTGIVLEVDGEVVVIGGYDGWTEGSCVMHQWIKHPKYMGRDILRAGFQYPFEIGGLQTVLGTVRSDNARALEINRKMGFLTAAIVPNVYGPGVDLHLLHLPRHLCKWITQCST